jgi:para-nitrobenzyl esterase
LDNFFKHRQSAYAIGNLFASKTSCGTSSNLACLRGLTVAEVRNATELMQANVLLGKNAFLPYMDGFDIAKGATITERFQSGAFNKVPILIGSDSGEFSLFILGLFNQDPAAVVVGQQLYDALMAENDMGDPRVRQYYTAQRFATVDPAQPLRGAIVAAITDKLFTCGSRFIASSFASAGNAAYLYYFSHAPVNGIYGNYPWMGAFHYAEVPFMFGNPADEFNYTRSFTPAEQVLSKRMMKYWLSFVESGNPNGLMTQSEINDVNLVTNWPRYTPKLDEMIILDTGNSLAVVRNKFTTPCAIWDTLGQSTPPPAPQSTSGSEAFGVSAIVALVVTGLVMHLTM